MRDTVLGGRPEELGCLTFQCKTVQRSRRHEAVGVSGGKDAGHQEGVDEMRESVDTHVLHCDDVGRGGAAAGAFVVQNMNQSRVVVGENDADTKGAEDEEASESPISAEEIRSDELGVILALKPKDMSNLHSLESCLDGYARVHCLSRNHGDIFRATDSPCGNEQGTEEALKFAQRTSCDIFGKGAGITPISEAIGIVLRVSADHGDEGEEKQDDDENDFARRQPELRLSVPTDGEDVDERIEEDTDETDGPDGDVVPPKLQNQVERRDLERDEDGFVEEEIPARHETEGLVDPFSGISDEGTRHGHVHGHLGDAAVDGSDQTAEEDEAQQERAWPSLEKTPADAHEERRADRTTNRNPLDLSVVE